MIRIFQFLSSIVTGRGFDVLTQSIVFILLLSAPMSSAAKEPDTTMLSPYATIYSFLYYLQEDTYKPEIAAKSLAGVSGKVAVEKAIKLKSALDGGGYFVQVSKLPRDTDYIDSSAGEAIYYLFPDRRPELYVEKYGNKWLFSHETVRFIDRFYEIAYPYGIARLLELMPKKGGSEILGVSTWKLIAFGVIILLTVFAYFATFYLIKGVLFILSRRYFHRIKEEKKRRRIIATVVSAWICLGIFILLLPGIAIPVKVLSVFHNLLQIIRTFLLMVVFLKLADVLFLYAKDYVEKTPSKLDNQLLPIFTKSIQAIIIIGAVIYALQQMDVNITALIAGLSIGGLAVALAAQDTVKNFIGSAMIFIDKPFQIGDYIQTSSYEGTVEEVGFRSLRLRNVDRSVISIPNGNVANDTIINLGLRPMRRIQLNIGVMYSTPPSSIELYLQALRDLVQQHPHTSKTDYIIRFHNLGNSSLDMFFRVYVFASTIADELRIREELLYGIVRLAGEMEIGFAFPSTSVYMEQTAAPAPPVKSQGELRETIAAFLAEYDRKVKQSWDLDREDSSA